jgi:hypothetical protein
VETGAGGRNGGALNVPALPAVRRVARGIAIALTLAAIVAIVALAWRIHEERAFFEPRSLLSRFPAEDATVLSVDFALLRHAGLLAESKTPPEPDYKSFVDGAGFDYRRDLDSVVAAFSASGNFFIARGRFNWDKLRDYTLHRGGLCYQQLCRVEGSAPDRRISFLPLRPDVIALAVSTNDLAATRLTTPANPITASLPAAPAWLSVPGAQLRKPTSLPPNLHLMLSALATTDRVLITFQPAEGGIEARLETTCRTAGDARVLASQLRTTTASLKEALSQDKQSAQDDLALALTAGTFDQNDRKVTGKWPVRKGLLDSLTAGI